MDTLLYFGNSLDKYVYSTFLVAEETATLLPLELCIVLFNLPQLDEQFEKVT